MGKENFVRGNDENEVWQQIYQQFDQNPDPLEYVAIIQQGNLRLTLAIDIDLGSGFESGYETTTLTAALPASTDFRFAVHDQHFTDEIGKFFGMQDVVIGFEEFDRKLIIKTNDEARVKMVFADASIRKVFESLENFTFGIHSRHSADTAESEVVLELVIEAGITDPARLRSIYNAFFSVLNFFGHGEPQSL